MTDTAINGNEPDDTAAPDTGTADNGTTATVDELDVHNGEPDRPKFTDANGIARVAGPPSEGFTPAPVEPTDDQIAANKAFHESDASAGFAPADDVVGSATSAERDPATLPTDPPAYEPPADTAAPVGFEDFKTAIADRGAVDPVPGSTPAEPAVEAAVEAAAVDTSAADTTTPAPADAVPDGDQAAVEAAATAAADAEVQAEVDADRAQAAAEEAAADAAALTEAEATEVKDEEATS